MIFFAVCVLLCSPEPEVLSHENSAAQTPMPFLRATAKGGSHHVGSNRNPHQGEIVSAKRQAVQFSQIGMTHGGGVPLLTIFDPHTLSLREMFEKNMVVDFKTALSLLGERLALFGSDEKISLGFPDQGAVKRFSKVIADSGNRLFMYPKIICDKVRGEGDQRVVTIREGNAQGQHVVMIDDLIKTGGTAIDCARALREAGAAKLSVFTTHGVFPNESWKRFAGGLFDHVWITDSCPVSATSVTKYGAPFEVLSLAEPICRILFSHR